MKNRAKAPKGFAWTIRTEPKAVSGKVCFQTQCSSGGGGNGRCGKSSY